MAERAPEETKAQPDCRSKALIRWVIVGLLLACYGVPITESVLNRFFTYRTIPALEGDYASIHPPRFYPFASYPMYAWDFDEPTIYALDLRGVQNGREVHLLPKKVFRPYWEAGMREALHTHIRNGGDLKSFFQPLYHRCRSSHSLTAMKVGVARWSWENWLNFKATGVKDYRRSSFSPDSYELLIELGP